VAHFPYYFLPFRVVYFPLHSNLQLPSVCRVSLSALGWHDVAALYGEFVARGQCGLLEEDLPYPDAKTVSLGDIFRLGIWVAIEKGLGANVLDCLVELAALVEDCIEGVDVRVDGCGKGGVGGMVFWRVLKEALPPSSIEFGGPLCVGSGHGRHDCGLGVFGGEPYVLGGLESQEW
jgi:hypothetical protein